MGSKYFGELGLGRGRSSSSSSRKGKKSGSEKPKQPQRGLGVAQLEKIRIQNQMAEYPPSLQPPFLSNHRMEDMGVDTALSGSPSSSKMASSSSDADFAFHPNVVMGYGDTERRHIADGEFHSSPSSRPLSNHDCTFPPSHYTPATVTRPYSGQAMEVNSMQKKERHDQSRSTGLMSQKSEYSDTEEEIDLELRLSI